MMNNVKGERSSGLPLSEKQGVGSSILPLATSNLFNLFKNSDKTQLKNLSKLGTNLIF